MPVDLKNEQLQESPAVSSTPTHRDSSESGREKRRETRYPCNDAAKLRRILDGNSFSATVLDVSRSGLGIATSAPLIQGSQVEIQMRDVVIFGDVRHCRREAEGFHAGVAIQDVFYSVDFAGTHIHENKFAQYLAGKGLTTREALEIGEHLRTCRLCESRAKHDAASNNQV